MKLEAMIIRKWSLGHLGQPWHKYWKKLYSNCVSAFYSAYTQPTFTCSKSTIETRKMCGIYSRLKLVPAILYQIFIFHQMIALQKLWKMFFISSKKLFSFSRYSHFCIFVFPSFFPLSAIAWEVDQRKILKIMSSAV